ncbi:MAG: ferritin-like domain-containing protein [Cyanobacteria bacterium J06598_1]
MKPPLKPSVNPPVNPSVKPSVAGLSLPALEPAHRLNKILSSALGRKSSADTVKIDVPPWGADCFGLAYSPLFNESTPLEQQHILHLASDSLLLESYAIEKAGVGYMAKMVLLAKTTEERMLYSLFGADETAHLAQLMPFVPVIDDASKRDPFLQLLESLLETADRWALMFVIQVVLEGWGLSHYRMLSKTCRDQSLGALFRSFVQAEARHHGAGVILFDADALTADSRVLIGETLAAFLQMVQVGPQRIVEAIAQVKGGLSRVQRIRVLTELDTETHSGRRLNLLRSLISPVAPSVAETLDQRGLFAPLPPAQCL